MTIGGVFIMYKHQRSGVLLIFLLIMLILNGCGGASDQKTTMNRYADDGYMGFSTANPGILTSPNSQTYGNDTTVVEQTLTRVPHIVGLKVFFRGATVVARIRVDHSLTAYEVDALRADALERLTAAMPRYTVRVVVHQ
jgi:hypothetical protein